jgi:hypothetical protein
MKETVYRVTCVGVIRGSCRPQDKWEVKEHRHMKGDPNSNQIYIINNEIFRRSFNGRYTNTIATKSANTTNTNPLNARTVVTMCTAWFII